MSEAVGEPHRLTEIADTLSIKPSTASHYLAELRAAGLAFQPVRVHWQRTDCAKPIDPTATFVTYRRADGMALSRSAVRVLELIDAGINTLAGLVERLDVSRQRVDQILKKLRKRGVLDRMRAHGSEGMWLWHRVDRPLETIADERALGALQSNILRSLPEKGWVNYSTLAERYGVQLRKAVEKLVRAGLVITLGRSTRKVFSIDAVRLTDKGRSHPLRTPASERLPVEGMDYPMKGFVDAVVPALAGLGPSRAFEIRAAAEQPTDLFGQKLQRLCDLGVIEQMNDPLAKSRGMPRYGLTQFSLSLLKEGIVPIPTMPEVATMHRRAADALDHWFGQHTQSNGSRRTVMRPKGGQAILYEHLLMNGPSTRQELERALPELANMANRIYYLKRMKLLTILEDGRAKAAPFEQSEASPADLSTTSGPEFPGVASMLRDGSSGEDIA